MFVIRVAALDSSTPPALRSLPNALSGLRLGCAIALPFSPPSAWLGLVLAAAASDWLDGWIARRLHATSWLGGLLDGFTDKAFVVTALVTFSAHGLFDPLLIPPLLVRDLSVAAGVGVSALRGDREAFRHMDSRTFGKLTTVLIFAWIVTVLVWPEARATNLALYLLCVLASVAAGVDYTVSRFRRVTGTEERGAPE